MVLEKPGLWNVLDWSPDGKKLLLNYMSARSSLAYASNSLHEFDLAAARQATEEARKKDYTFSLFYPSSQQIQTLTFKIVLSPAPSRHQTGVIPPTGRPSPWGLNESGDPRVRTSSWACWTCLISS